MVLLVVALKLHKPVSDIGTIYAGSCDRDKSLSNYLLIPLNVIGTISVGTSNYKMQILNAPNRKEVDKAHAEGHHLNIGISSPSNMKRLGDSKRYLYYALALSTQVKIPALLCRCCGSLITSILRLKCCISKPSDSVTPSSTCISLTPCVLIISHVFNGGRHVSATYQSCSRASMLASRRLAKPECRFTCSSTLPSLQRCNLTTMGQ